MPEVVAPAVTTEEVKVEAPVVAVEAPKEAPTTPEAPVASSTEAAQYELPDGTKTDAETLAKEWRDKFMPDYTRKSQELAAIKAKTEQKPETPSEVKAAWEDPEWQPKTYQEFGKLTAEQAAVLAEQRVWQKILSESERGEREAKEREAYIQQETEQLKALDPKVDVSRVMSHAAKYAFSSLIPAYQNMRALEDAERRTEERIMKNVKLRASEPVGVASAQTSTVTFPPGIQTGVEKARWIIRNNK